MQHFPIAAITDEFATDDLEVALRAMEEIGMTGAELRVVGGRNIIELSDEEIARARAQVEAHGMRVLSIASPLLKCVLPGGPPLDERFQQDVFGSAYTFEDQPRLTRRAFDIAEQAGARLIRVFSYWRTIDPQREYDRIAAALSDLADQALERGLVIGLENEHACNVGTGAEAARMLAAVDHPALKLIWDPANAFILGETPYPSGYASLPADRIVHVHAKDCVMAGLKPAWGPLGEMGVDWKGQVAALVRDGYQGAVSLETHWRGPDGDRLQASIVCGKNLRELVS
ncbi:MAG: sugar phosphate isomerase/epimerase, partial [Acidobacteriota bacterium]|nr:sugar phosphate isomerase/epimerase [Acidobacteriota bacterium]